MPMMGVFDKLFPPQPGPDPARLALARTSVAAMWPDGAYARPDDDFAGGMIDRVMRLKKTDLPTGDAKNGEGRRRRRFVPARRSRGQGPLFRSARGGDPRGGDRGDRQALDDHRAARCATAWPESMARRFDARQLADINGFLATAERPRLCRSVDAIVARPRHAARDDEHPARDDEAMPDVMKRRRRKPTTFSPPALAQRRSPSSQGLVARQGARRPYPRPHSDGVDPIHEPRRPALLPRPRPRLVLEMVRVTEAAAIAASKLIGRGDEKAADPAAVEAMRAAQRAAVRRHRRDRRGRARRSADALHRREGRFGPRQRPEDRHRARPARGHDAHRQGRARTRSRCSPSRSRAACSTRPTSIWRSWRSAPVIAAGTIDLNQLARRQRARRSPRPRASRPDEIIACVLDRAATRRSSPSCARSAAASS